MLGKGVGVKMGQRYTGSARLASKHAVGVYKLKEVHVGY